jgi:arylsulfatase A-like enzyme
MNRVKITDLLALGAIGGFFAGLIAALINIASNEYWQYGMFRLAALSFQRQINKWMFLGLFFGGLIYLVIRITKLGSFRIKILSQSIKLYSSKAAAFNKWAFGLVAFGIILNSGIFIDGIINAPQGPNVILISIDTLRADHLGCYGYDFDTSPYIDEFARESVLFKNAKSQIHWTLPSHISFLTSLYPSVFKKWARLSCSAIEDKYLMLAEIMRNYRYKTAAFTGGGWLTREYGFDQGFDYFKGDIKSSNIERVFNKYGIDWIRKQKGKFFVFLHCYEPHAPYDPPRPFKEKFVLPSIPSEFTDYCSHIADDPSEVREKTLKWFWDRKDRKSVLNTIIGLYDGEIAAVDAGIERLFEEIKRLGIFENSLIIFLSDHGEAFLEHGFFGHYNLYEEILKVPLVIHLPKAMQQYNKRTIDELVGLVDVLPTILDICGISYPSDRFQGISLLNLINGRGIYPRDFVFSENLVEKAAATARYKYRISKYGQDNEEESLYDLSSDPQEKRDLLEENIIDLRIEKIYQQLKIDIFRQLNKDAKLIRKRGYKAAPKNEIHLSRDTREQLRALGYLQ